MRLRVEQLEDRRVLSAYTVDISDMRNLVSTSVEDQMRLAANYVMTNLSRFVSWKGTIDLKLDIQPPNGVHDGITPAIMQTRNGKNLTVQEMVTGVDPDPKAPDVGMTIYLGNDGTVKVYGMKAYFDPQPMPFVPATVPSGHIDFIGLLNHEVAHGLAFQWGTTNFSRHVINVGGNYYFNGPETVKTLGKPLPMSTFGGTHYGNYLLPNNPIKSGLMYQFGNYGGNRLDYGRLDFAVLRDVGLSTKDLSGFPLVDRIDSQAPKLFVSKTSVNENLPAGTTVATLSSSRGPDYTFQIVPGWDSSNFRISGRSLVTTDSFNFEAKNSYTIYVRSVDKSGVWGWTDTKLTVTVNDVRETPQLHTPSFITLVNGLGPLNQLSLSGDRGTMVHVGIISLTGTLEARFSDPSIRIGIVKNSYGGMTLSMSGTVEAITRNFRNVYYRGKDASLNVQMVWGGNNLADRWVPLRQNISAPIVV
jgi:hypothetical protein